MLNQPPPQPRQPIQPSTPTPPRGFFPRAQAAVRNVFAPGTRPIDLPGAGFTRPDGARGFDNWELIPFDAELPRGRTLRPTTGNMNLSGSGADFLMRREAPWQPQYRVVDDQGRITHIRLHNVGDGGYTAGFGLFFPYGDPRIQQFQGQLSVKEARELMLQRVQQDVDAINNWLRANNVTVTQNQFDALVTHRYNRGNISRLLPFLLSGDFSDRDALFNAMIEGTNPNFREGLTNRYNEELEIFLNNNFNVGPQFQFNFD